MKKLLSYTLLLLVMSCTTAITAQAQKINIISPAGGEALFKGQSYTIRWESQGVSGNVEIRMDYPGSSIKLGNVDVARGSYSFSIPENWPERDDWNAVVTAYRADNGRNVWATSSKLSVTNNAPQISIINPVGGENWIKGQSYTIRWVSQGVSGNVEIRMDYPGSSIKLGNVDVARGSYSFSIPENWPERDDWNAVVTAYGADNGRNVWTSSKRIIINK